MQEILLDSKFIFYAFEPQNQLLIYNSKPESFYATEQDYIEFVDNIRRFSLEYTPKKILNDTSKSQFTVHPDLQKYTAQTIVPAWLEIKVEKFAIVLGGDYFAQVSTEQILDEKIDKVQHVESYKAKKFSSYDDAYHWLINS